jgi:hypothetical protein
MISNQIIKILKTIKMNNLELKKYKVVATATIEVNVLADSEEEAIEDFRSNWNERDYKIDSRTFICDAKEVPFI